jgi:hypothetical protein
MPIVCAISLANAGWFAISEAAILMIELAQFLKLGPGADGALHRCVPRSVTNVTNKPVTNNETVSVTNASDIDRVLRWRAANRDRYRTYMRDLMRRRRAK